VDALADAVMSRRLACFKAIVPIEGSTVPVAKLGLHLASGGEGLARPDSNAFLVAVTRGTRAGEIVRTEEAEHALSIRSYARKRLS
jgi:hypothetical protein